MLRRGRESTSSDEANKVNQKVIADLVTNNAELEEEAATARSSLNKEKGNSVLLRRERDSAMDSLTKEHQKRRKIAAKLFEKEQQLEDERNRADGYKKKFGRLEIEVEVKTARAKKLQERVDSQQEELLKEKNLKVEAALLASNLKKEVESLKEELEKEKTFKEVAAALANSLDVNLKSKTKELQKEKYMRVTADTLLASLRQQLEGKEQELETEKEATRALHEQLNQKEQELQDATTRANNLQTEMREKEEEFKRERAQLVTLEMKLRDIEIWARNSPLGNLIELSFVSSGDSAMER